MEKIFDYEGKRYHFMECTVIANCNDYKEEYRQHAVFYWYEDPFPGDTDCVIFGCNMPEDIDDVERIFFYEDPDAFDTYCETLDTIRFEDGRTYEEWNADYCR